MINLVVKFPSSSNFEVCKTRLENLFREVEPVFKPSNHRKWFIIRVGSEKEAEEVFAKLPEGAEVHRAPERRLFA